MILAIVLGIVGVTILSLIVFGGGQVFMPLFQSFWLFLGNNLGVNIDQSKIDAIFTISNATPGVVSTKFAAFTGLLIANNEWWGWILAFFTYLVFCIPAIFLMLLASKMVNKASQTKYLSKLTIVFKPILAAIMISLAIQLLISSMFPQLIFNKGINDYFDISQNPKSLFFSGWRYWVLIVWVPIFVIISFILYNKKIPLFWIFLGGIIISFVLFQPWL